mgnify:CR=1 FL=1
MARYSFLVRQSTLTEHEIEMNDNLTPEQAHEDILCTAGAMTKDELAACETETLESFWGVEDIEKME